jgi:3-hydroxyisobutyrate dehydrogenase-like beta-hydroxyacid dehydrogenase
MTEVGMIGLGQIGLPMAQNLILGGYSVVGYRRGDMSEFAAAGGIPASSAKEVADRCSIILSCLPDNEALRSTVSGSAGVLHGSCNGRILVELSTLDINVKTQERQALRDRGGDMLDCSVSGVPRMVQQRKGVIFASGEEQALERVRIPLAAIAERSFYFGEFGNATKAKLTANILVALKIVGTAEALAFGMKAGLAPDLLIEALEDGAGTSLQFKVRAPVMASREWDRVMASTSLLLKDIRLIERMRDALHCPTPMLDAATKLYEATVSAGLGEADVASVFSIFANLAGLNLQAESESGTAGQRK